MLKIILIGFFISIPLFSQEGRLEGQSESGFGFDFSRPQWVKNFSVEAKSSYESNYLNISKENLSEIKNINFKDQTLSSMLLGLKTKFLFKPFEKYILINNFSVDAEVTQFSSELSDSNFSKPSLRVVNDLIGIIPLNSKHQLGHLIRASYVKDQSIEINAEIGKDVTAQIINQDHVLGALNLFYQYKVGKFWTTRLDSGLRITSYENDYSSFTEVKGEKSDSLESSLSLKNNFNFSREFNFFVPVSYFKTYYRNRAALGSDGYFITSGAVARDQLEKRTITPGFKLRTPLGDFALSQGLIWHKDLNYGGRSYNGTLASFNYSLSLMEDKHVFYLEYEQIDLDYDQALDENREARRDKIQKYAANYTLKKVFNSSFDINVGYQYHNLQEGYLGGKFENEIYQIGLNYQL